MVIKSELTVVRSPSGIKKNEEGKYFYSVATFAGVLLFGSEELEVSELVLSSSSVEAADEFLKGFASLRRGDVIEASLQVSFGRRSGVNRLSLSIVGIKVLEHAASSAQARSFVPLPA